MKLNRPHVLIAVSSGALLAVLFIQVNWILQTAKMKEALFNERANLVLSKATEALSADEETCKKIEECVDMDSASGTIPRLGTNEARQIDSLFAYYMRLYNVQMNYTVVVAKPTVVEARRKTGLANYLYPDQPRSYKKSLQELASEKGVELKLIFPEKGQYIMAEMGLPFITSVLLIVIVFVLFWQTILSLRKEKKISEHVTDFLNNMTHEFKTPLTNIALAGKLITKETVGGQEDKIIHYSAIILEENEKLRLQVEQVLHMTALERGEIPLVKAALDFHQLIQDVVKCMSVQVEHKQGALKLNMQADKFMVMGDKIHLGNALTNLIDNALKYAKGNPDLLIHTTNMDGCLVVAVTDKGIGIEKVYQKKVFDKFFRVPTGDLHDVKGFGLGLTYIKKIIQLHGGGIELQSEKGKGTTFTITLPNA